MKKAAQQKSKSLKTFYLYAVVVGLLICLSLLIKGFFIIQQSKFDPAHDFTLAVTRQGSVKEVIAFHTQTPSVVLLVIKDRTVPYETLARDYGIAVDGYVQVGNDMPLGTDVTAFLWTSLLHTALWQSDLTVLDKIRLLLLSKGVMTNNKTIEEIFLTKQNAQLNTILSNALINQDFATENISIQIVNATDVSGFGQRLGRVLTNMGANVVDVSSAQNTQAHTTIGYYGNNSYTVGRIQKMLGVSATRLTRQTIANIVITIGTDKQDTKEF